MRKDLFMSILLMMGLSIACVDQGEKRNKDNEKEGKSELKAKAEAPAKEHLDKAYYPIPSPEQMFGFINDNGVEYSKALINSVDNAEKYVEPAQKALNFGVYTADLAYAAAYEDIGSTIDLYKTVRMIGGELNINEMMSEKMMNKVQQNLQDKDSLSIIAGRSYYQAVDYLEQNGQQGKLALMSLGGWIESLYITINAMDGYVEGSETIQRIADQKITFGNLYTYLRKNENKTGVKEAIKAVQPIRSVFASLVEKKVAKKSKSTSGKMVLGGESKITMTEAQFKELKNTINSYRSKITGESI
jgi:hypothetical protein